MSTLVQNNSGRNVFVDLDGYDRIRAHSPDHINRKVEREIEECIRAENAKDPAGLSEHLRKLDQEWDVDRATMLWFSFVGTAILYLGVKKNPKWLTLFGIFFPFLAHHAANGWCPPVSVLRRLGFRSSREIDAERYALKTMRGDFVRRSA